VDALDWDCQNEDNDLAQNDVDGNTFIDDPIVNGVDAMNFVDNNNDGVVDLCSLASVGMTGGWEEEDAIVQGSMWGGTNALNASYTEPLVDRDGDGLVDSWCHSFLGSGTGNGILLYVSAKSVLDVATPVDTGSSADWYHADWANFCTYYDDPACDYVNGRYWVHYRWTGTPTNTLEPY
jgi:hypothetical protein